MSLLATWRLTLEAREAPAREKKNAVWTSFVLLEREQTSKRKNTANSALPNILIPVDSFSAGELYVRGPSGQVELEVAKGLVIFCARHHAHWSKPSRGRRVVLALFSLSGALNLIQARAGGSGG